MVVVQILKGEEGRTNRQHLFEAHCLTVLYPHHVKIAIIKESHRVHEYLREKYVRRLTRSQPLTTTVLLLRLLECWLVERLAHYAVKECKAVPEGSVCTKGCAGCGNERG